MSGVQDGVPAESEHGRNERRVDQIAPGGFDEPLDPVGEPGAGGRLPGWRWRVAIHGGWTTFELDGGRCAVSSPMGPMGASATRSASDNYTGRPVTLKKVAQLVRGAADLAADRCERPDRERPGAMPGTLTCRPSECRITCWLPVTRSSSQPPLPSALTMFFPESRTGIRPRRRR